MFKFKVEADRRLNSSHFSAQKKKKLRRISRTFITGKSFQINSCRSVTLGRYTACKLEFFIRADLRSFGLNLSYVSLKNINWLARIIGLFMLYLCH